MKLGGFEGNITKYYLLRTLVGFRFIASIRVLFFLVFISYAQIGVTELVAAIVILALEIPSGVFADMIGRKMSMLIGTVLSTLAFLCVGLGSGLLVFAIGWALSGASDAFHSGANEAMLYDSLQRIGREEDYLKILSRLGAINAVTTIIGSIAGAYLFEINIRLPWLLFAVCIGLSGVVILFMKEPHISEEGYTVTNQFNHFKTAFAFCASHETVRWLIGFLLVLSVPMFAFATLMSQPYLTNRGYQVTSLGFIFALIHGTSGLVGGLSHRVEERLGEKVSFVLITILYVTVLVLAGLWRTKVAALLLVIVLYTVNNYRGVLFDTYLNAHIRSENRATVLSIRSFLNNVVVTLLAVFIGRLIDLYTMDPVLVGMGILLGLFSIPFLVKRYRTRLPRVAQKAL